MKEPEYKWAKDVSKMRSVVVTRRIIPETSVYILSSKKRLFNKFSFVSKNFSLVTY